MAGTVRGKIDAFHNPGTRVLMLQEVFKNIFDRFTASPRHSIIARFNGDAAGNIPAGGGPGTTYHDGANPFRRNAFFVVDFLNASTRYHLLVQLQDGSSETVNGGGTIDGGTVGSLAGIGLAMATAKTSGGAWASPWGGTTNNNGADTKTTAWWAAPGGGRLYPFPRNNAGGGSYNTNKNNMSALLANTFNGSVTSARAHIVFDDDNWCFAIDEDDAGGYVLSTGGVYLPRSDLTVDRPLVMLVDKAGSSDAFPRRYTSASFVYGKAGTGTTSYDGGIRGTDNLVGVGGAGVGIDVHPAIVDDLSHFTSGANQQPNRAFATAALDEFPIFLGAEEAAAAYGYLGTYDFVRQVYNANNKDTNIGKTRAYFGNATTLQRKWSIPWGGSQTPGTAVNRAGVDLPLWPK